MANTKIRVGGLKVMEGGACVVSSFPPGGDTLGARVCSPLAQNRINLTLLTHVAANRRLDSFTVFCTELAAGAASYSISKAHGGNQSAVRLHTGTCLVALYPHNKRPEIAGNFIRSLAQARVIIRGLASSPSAIAAVLSLEAKNRAIKILFDHFDFPGYHSPDEFLAIQSPPEELVRKVIATYQEKVIRIYGIDHQSDLDLWDLSVPSSETLEDFGMALIALGNLELQIPFIVALPGPDKKFLVSFCLSSDRFEAVNDILIAQLPHITVRRRTPVAAIFVHGPHFGDRYGIASTLVEALEKAHISLLALSCTVSSISAIIIQQNLSTAVQVLGQTFEAATF